jgi:hypothetical protein
MLTTFRERDLHLHGAVFNLSPFLDVSVDWVEHAGLLRPDRHGAPGGSHDFCRIAPDGRTASVTKDVLVCERPFTVERRFSHQVLMTPQASSSKRMRS